MSNNTPKIYVACLAAYNAGILYGEWIDLSEVEEITSEISTILEKSPIEGAEEWAVHDYEFCGSLSEYCGAQVLEDLKDAYAATESEAIDWDLFCEFCSHKGEDINSQSIASYSEAYAGLADTLVSWCQSFLEETGQLESIPESLRFYFDYEAYARDLEIGDVFTIRHNSETHVFWNQ